MLRTLYQKNCKFYPVLLTVLLIALPGVAFAGLGTEVEKVLNDIMFGIGGMFVLVGGLLLDYSISFLVIQFGSFLISNVGVAVDQLWTVIRDVFNIIFIFSLIMIGFKIILKSDDTGTRRALGLLIVAALLINFSLFFTKTIVDFSNLAAFEIHGMITTTESYKFTIAGGTIELGELSGISGAFMELLDLNTFATQKSLSGAADIFSGKAVMFGFMMMLFMVFTGFIFAAGAILMITRFVALVIFMIFSPVMFLGWIYPGFAKYGAMWWSKFLNYAFLAPAYLFMMYLSLFTLEKTIVNKGGTFVSAYTDGAGETGAFMLILNYAIIMGFLVASLLVAKSMGAAGAAGSLNMINGARKGMQGAVGRQTIGRVGAGGLQLSEALEKSRAGRNFKRGLTLLTGGVIDEQARRKAFTKARESNFGGSRSHASNRKWEEDNATMRARGESVNSLSSSIKSGAVAVPTTPEGIAFSDAISGASPAQLTEQLKKYKPGSEEYEAIVRSMNAEQVKKVMDAKPEEFNETQKAALGNSRQTIVRENTETVGAASGAVAGKELAQGIRKASIPDLAALGLDTVKDNAGQLQATQLEKMKDDSHFQGPRYTILKDAYEAQIKAMGIPDLIQSRTNDENIAKLPKDILTGPNFMKSLEGASSGDRITNSLLSQIANRNDLDGTVKQQIGRKVLDAYGATTTTDPKLPKNLLSFFKNGAGTNMIPD